MNSRDEIMARMAPDPALQADARLKLGMIGLILAPVAGVLMLYGTQPGGFGAGIAPQDWLRFCAMLGLSLFLPLMAYSYYFFRKERRRAEISRIIGKLDFEDSHYVEMFRSIHSGPYFVIAVAMAWAVALACLAVLFFGAAVWPLDPQGPGQFPKPGSQLVFGMAFLGAYFWGIQHVFRRYVLNDLNPGAFFKLSIRMLLAATLVLILFNVFDSIAIDGDPTFQSGAWPALAFALGAFPQRCLDWMIARVPILSEKPDPSVRRLPLGMIEGLDAYDRMRFEEVGIDDCYDLAHYDFVPLLLKTAYDARKLADWILQAKLCIHFGEAVGDLRQQGIRGIHDLANISKEQIERLANETSATLFSLERTQQIAAADHEIKRLQEVAGQLSRYTRAALPVSREPEPTK